MIITDLMELVGKKVEVTMENGTIANGVLEYVPAYSELYGYKKAKHFYLPCEGGKTLSFRAHHVRSVKLL